MTSSNVPWRLASPLWERGKSSYQLANSAFRRSEFDRDRRIEADFERARIGGRVNFGRLLPEQDGEPSGIVGVLEAIRDGLEPHRRLPARLSEGLAKNGLALVDLKSDRQTGVVLLLQFKAINGEFVAPGFDGEQVATDALERQIGRPAVVAQRRHALLSPGGLVRGSPQKRDGYRIMALAIGVTFDPNRLADDPLHRMTNAVEARRDRFDDQPRRARGLFRRRPGFVRPQDDLRAMAFENTRFSRAQRQELHPGRDWAPGAARPSAAGIRRSRAKWTQRPRKDRDP